MNQVARDALMEAHEVLRDLAGYLKAIEKTQGARMHPLLAEISARVTDITQDALDLSSAPEVGCSETMRVH